MKENIGLRGVELAKEIVTKLKSFIDLKTLLISIFILGIIILIYKIKEKIQLSRWLESNFMNIDTIENLDGFEFEEYVAEQLDRLGFKVELLPKSGDFGVDLIVEGYGIQLKNYTNVVGVSAVQEVYAGAAYYGKVPVVLITNYYSSSAIELARALDIELIDLDDILNWGNKKYIRNLDHSTGFYEMVKDKLIKNLNTGFLTNGR